MWYAKVELQPIDEKEDQYYHYNDLENSSCILHCKPFEPGRKFIILHFLLVFFSIKTRISCEDDQSEG